MSVNTGSAVASSIVVAAAVVAGLYLGGTPGEQRLVRFDLRRVSDLQSLSSAIDRRWESFEQLPATLDELVDGVLLKRMPLDPETGAPYVYEPIADNSYRLCATFSRATVDPRPGDFWVHEPGYRCFDFTLVASEPEPGPSETAR